MPTNYCQGWHTSCYVASNSLIRPVRIGFFCHGPMLPRHLYLTFHGLGAASSALDDDVRRYWIDRATFEETLDSIPQVERLTGTQIHLTFDDGNSSDFDVALPCLVTRGLSAIFFVCAGRIGASGFVDARQINEISSAGMEIGCHGYDHLNWSEASDEILQRELRDARSVIEAVSGREVTMASAPFGALSQRAVDVAKQSGFRCLFASSGGYSTSTTGLIPRNSLKSDFKPGRDLVQMASWPKRARAAFYDPARRLKYGFY
jgi:peptidoglycan/xylan/chitin deacetylase (PgdA/CDA1 family)